MFESAVLQKLIDARFKKPITLVTDTKHEYDDDDMKVICDGDKLIRVGKDLSPDKVNGESIGMMAFRGDGPNQFSAKIEHLMRRGHGIRKWYLSAIDELAQEGRVNTCSIAGLSWCEIDNHADLDRASAIISAWYPTAGSFASRNR
jgi:choline kinase